MTFNPRLFSVAAILSVGAFATMTIPSSGQDAPDAPIVPAAPTKTNVPVIEAPTPAVTPTIASINYRERPSFPFDAQRLRRRPVIDGVITPNEWDALYTVGDGAIKGTVYVNWDDDFLFVAAKTDKPGWFVFDVDSNDDGWLRGGDNLEVTIAPGAEDGKAIVTTRILDAAGNKDAPVWNDRVVDPKSLTVAQKVGADGQTIEIAIPKGIAGLNPRVNAAIAFRGDFLPASASPTATAPYEPHLLVDLTMVDARIVAASGITPKISLDDNRVVPGQTIRATLELQNQTEDLTSIKSVTWQGEAAAADILKLIREVNIQPIKGQKSLKLRYNSQLPDTAVPGYYQVSANAVLDNGKQISVTTSFAVVEPFNVSLITDPLQVSVNGPSQVKAIVEIFSAVPVYARGDVQIELPAGWEVKGKSKYGFFVSHEDAAVKAPFTVLIPSSTPSGDYVLNATITWHGKTWKAHRSLHVIHVAETAPTTSTAVAPSTAPKEK